MEVTKNRNNGTDMKNHPAKKSHTALDRLFRYAELLKYGEVHFKFDPKTGLRAIVAIHNLNRGPAIGGCRMIHYHSADKALEDAMRLAQMMSLKAAISNLPHGGAKAVIMKPKVVTNRIALLESFGDFVESLGGRYITAMDSGTSESDMDIIATRTKYASCTTGADGDPSPQTAFGVFRGIEAAVKYKLGRDSVEGVRVNIQGVGHVGYYLAKELHARGAKMTVCDVNEKNLQRCRDEFNVDVCSTEEIFDLPGDVFSPCALGAILNLETIKQLKTPIVAGSANNQLAHSKFGDVMRQRGILYAPDFVINAGGLINVAVIYAHQNVAESTKQTSHLYDILMEIFERADKENLATNQVAEKIAKEKLNVSR